MPFQLLDELAVLLHEALFFQTAVDDGQQAVRVDGLFQVGKGAVVERFHRVLHGGVAGEHDGADVRVFGDDGGEEFRAVDVRQADIQDDDVVEPLPEARQGVLPGGGGMGFQAFLFQDAGYDIEKIPVIVDDEDILLTMLHVCSGNAGNPGLFS